jgi:hypothetical protein
MKSQHPVGVLMVVALLLTVLAIALPPALSVVASPQRQEFSATLAPVAGLVQYLARGSAQWVTLRDTQLLNRGDQVRTGNDGYARLSVVTGIDVDIYPTSLLALNSLAMQPESGEVFSLYLLRGLTFSNVTQSVKQQDRIQIIIPSAGITVRGTQFYTFVSPVIHAAVITQENKVEVQTISKETFIVTPDDFLYIKFKLPEPLTQVCSDPLLNSAAKATTVIEPVTQDKLQALRDFMRDSVISNVDPQVRAFFRTLVDLPPVDPTKLTPDEDKKALDELLDAIDKLPENKLPLKDFLQKYRDFWAQFKTTLTKPLAGETCGNGRQDEGETAESCPTDFSEPAACGNGLCEITRAGLAESVVNCAADCLPYGSLALSCAATVDSALNPGTLPGVGVSGGGGPTGPIRTPLPTIEPSGTTTPTPSGVG